MPSLATSSTATDTSPSPAAQDPPPAYTPYTLPPYTHFDSQADRDSYAISLMMHNLRINQVPGIPNLLVEEEETPDRIQNAALRDFRATQDPDQWGTRNPRRPEGEVQEDQRERGFWGRLVDMLTLFNPVQEEDPNNRDRYVNGIPIWVTPNGAI